MSTLEAFDRVLRGAFGQPHEAMASKENLPAMAQRGGPKEAYSHGGIVDNSENTLIRHRRGPAGARMQVS
jgi:hypothetical protein